MVNEDLEGGATESNNESQSGLFEGSLIVGKIDDDFSEEL
jgi:hypothetical protein